MIAFGSSITSPELYDLAAGKGIALAKEADSVVLANSAAGSIYRSYNLALEQAAALPDLEALVLVHQDAEITDPDFCTKIRAAMADPDVGVVGCVGAVGVRTIAWWEGSVTWASFTHKYSELGGGEIPSFTWDAANAPAYARTGEVDTVDGFCLVFSPWVVQNLRFDESLGMLHGYDFDFCLTVREAGKKVVTADLKVVHHHSLDLVNDDDAWMLAHQRINEKWEGRMPHVGEEGGDWKQRARRAEAEAAVTRAKVVSAQLKAEAQIRKLEEDFEVTVGSISWKLTEPLRRVNAWRNGMRTRRIEARGARVPDA